MILKIDLSTLSFKLIQIFQANCCIENFCQEVKLISVVNKPLEIFMVAVKVMVKF